MKPSQRTERFFTESTTRSNGFVAAAPFVWNSGSGNDIPPVVGVPFSAVATQQNVTKLLDGNRIVNTRTLRFYRDGQGRTRVEHLFSPALGDTKLPPSMIVSIYDPVLGERYMLHSMGRTATVYPTGKDQPIKPPVAAPSAPMQFSMPGLSVGFGGAHSAAKTSDLGEKIINGLTVVGTRVEQTIAAGAVGNEKAIAVTLEQWFSPEVGMVVENTQRSPTGMESTYHLEQIVRGEQDRELFVVPADYTKRDGNEGMIRLQPVRPQ